MRPVFDRRRHVSVFELVRLEFGGHNYVKKFCLFLLKRLKTKVLLVDMLDFRA